MAHGFRTASRSTTALAGCDRWRRLNGLWARPRRAPSRRAEVVDIADPDADRAAALARALGAQSTVADAADLLQANRVDAVHICTPLSMHGAIARHSIERGIHALVEKPLAKSAEETCALFDLARGKGRILCPVHQVAFQDGIADAMKTKVYLREPSAIAICIFSAGGAGSTGRELDAIAGDILPHPLSVLRKLWPNADWKPELWFVSRSQSG